MNRTTVKRGIGAVILALIAAALLAFLLKDKAAQRQEVVEIALPGTEASVEGSSLTTRLPTLNTENSGNSDGSVIANAGSGNGGLANSPVDGNVASNSSNDTDTNASSNNSDGTIIASAAAVGTAAGAAALASGAVADTAKTMDFSVKPRVATSKASSEFLDLDLVNNGSSNASAAKASVTAKASAAASTAVVASAAVASTTAASVSSPDNSQGVVIASTSPKSSRPNSNAVQPRLIGEKKAAPVKSSRTAKVISSKQAVTKSAEASQPKATPASTAQAKNGYAIQLLATSSVSRANNLKKVMSGEGYPTYVTKTKQNGKTLYRVRIGQYPVKSQAVKAQAAMKRRYKKNTNVTRSAVVAR